MIEAFIRILNEMDSFKKVAIFLLTGLTALVIYLGYKLSDTVGVYYSWTSVPHVIKTELPCNLVQIRSDYFLISISFPKPKKIDNEITTFTSSFWVVTKPNDDEFRGMCDDLITAINSNVAEEILKPYMNRPQ